MRRNNIPEKSTPWDFLLAMGIILAVWQLLTLFFPPLVLPGIKSVVIRLKEIFSTPVFYKMIGLTMERMALGLSAGVGAGLCLGLLMGAVGRLRRLFMPIIGILQTVPPVSWVVLALVWFGFNGRPVMFIIVISTIPVIAISVCEGVTRIDPKLLQMAFLYHFSRKKTLRHVVLPSIAPYFQSAFRIALGTGWKIAVMGEVLTTSDGIGGMIKQARLNIEPDSIIAWSAVLVGLFYLSDFIIDWFFRERRGWNGGN
ncbi:ABC transporter permease [Lacrimispora sp.]|uniref:ABC transporter permease n=1 Tax=Lacrimispora sp. TaxID=2719234 RepID=UPI002FD8D5B4